MKSYRNTPLFLLSYWACGSLACTGEVGLDKVSEPTSLSLVASTSGTISPKLNPERCLQPVTNTNGSQISYETCNGSAAQQWTLTDGIVKSSDGKCLDMTDGKSVAGEKPQIWDCFAGNKNQLWLLDGSQFKHTNTDVCLDVTDGVTSVGSIVEVWGCDTSPNQQWELNAAAPSGPPTLSAVVTTMDKLHLLASQHTATFSSSNSSAKSQYVFNLDPKVTYQTMDGFGASLTDSSASLLWKNLTSTQRQTLMQELFSPETGIGLSFLRQPMGATDFSASGNFSYDDVSSGDTDTSLAKFSVAHDEAYIIPLLQQALKLNPAINVYATPWSPPAWMKTSKTMNGGSLHTAYYEPMAQYFVKFIQAYGSHGIPIYAVAPQNEPENNNGSYPTSTLTSSQEADFVANNLGPALASAEPKVKIVGYEHNWGDTTYPEQLLASTGAAKYLAGTSYHCYSGSYPNQSIVEAKYPTKGIWFTECSGTVGSNFGGDLGWNAYNLFIGSVRNWARSVSLWNLALDENSGPKNGGCAHCRGVVTIDTSKSPAVVTHNVEYYLLGHLAKYVRPGAVRIESNTSNGGGLEDVAFRNTDGSTVLFILNSINSEVPITINWNGYGVNYTLLANSIYTMNWPAHS